MNQRGKSSTLSCSARETKSSLSRKYWKNDHSGSKCSLEIIWRTVARENNHCFDNCSREFAGYDPFESIDCSISSGKQWRNPYCVTAISSYLTSKNLSVYLCIFTVSAGTDRTVVVISRYWWTSSNVWCNRYAMCAPYDHSRTDAASAMGCRTWTTQPVAWRVALRLSGKQWPSRACKKTPPKQCRTRQYLVSLVCRGSEEVENGLSRFAPQKIGTSAMDDPSIEYIYEYKRTFYSFSCLSISSILSFMIFS